MYLIYRNMVWLLTASALALGCRTASPPLTGNDVFAPGENVSLDIVYSAPGLEDPFTRERMIALALEHNPTFDVFAANMAAAQAAIIQARAYPNPEIGGSIDWSDPREGGSTAREYGLEVSQRLEWPVQRRNRRLAAEAGVNGAAREGEAFAVTLRAETMRAFDKVLYHQRALVLAESNAEIARELTGLISRRVETGEAPEVDLVRARVELLQTRRGVQRERREIETARAVLRALTGHHLPVDFTAVDDLDGTTSIVATAATEEALADHPAIVQLLALREQRARELAQERVAWYPQPEPGVFFEREDDANVVGLSVGVEIPLWNRNSGGIALAEARLQEVEAEIRQTGQEMLRDFETATVAHESAREQIAIFEGGLLDDAQRALETQQFLYEQGEADLLQVFDARRLAQQTRAEYLRALLDAALARADLDEALGKGDDLP